MKLEEVKRRAKKGHTIYCRHKRLCTMAHKRNPQVKAVHCSHCQHNFDIETGKDLGHAYHKE